MPLTSKQAEFQTQHIKQQGGKVWYVDGTIGNDTNSGLDPDNAFLTIGYGITQLSAGDTINIKASVYTEIGLDLNVDSTYLNCELGAVFLAPTGTSLTISADYCSLSGETYILSTAANVGLDISGSGAVVKNVTVLGTDSSIGCRVTGLGCNITNVKVVGIVAGGNGFELTGNNTTIKECGSSGCTTCIGFYMNGSIGLLENCFSIGNGTSSYYFDSAATGWTVKGSTSGVGDGRYFDYSESNFFDGFSYNNRIERVLDITQVGAGTYEYNLFKISGIVKIIHIEGVVTSTLVGSNTNCHLDIYSVNGGDVVSKAVGLNMGAALEGSLVARLDAVDKVLAFHDSDQAFLIDQIDASNEGMRLGEDRTAGAHVDTFLRFIHSTAGASSGIIEWYVEFVPVSDDGWLTVV